MTVSPNAFKTEEKPDIKLGYVGLRISMKQKKIYKAMSDIQQMNLHKRKPAVSGIDLKALKE